MGMRAGTQGNLSVADGRGEGHRSGRGEIEPQHRKLIREGELSRGYDGARATREQLRERENEGERGELNASLQDRIAGREMPHRTSPPALPLTTGGKIIQSVCTSGFCPKRQSHPNTEDNKKLQTSVQNVCRHPP